MVLTIENGKLVTCKSAASQASCLACTLVQPELIMIMQTYATTENISKLAF